MLSFLEELEALLASGSGCAPSRSSASTGLLAASVKGVGKGSSSVGSVDDDLVEEDSGSNSGRSSLSKKFA